jgi:hypothetical protein
MSRNSLQRTEFNLSFTLRDQLGPCAHSMNNVAGGSKDTGKPSVSFEDEVNHQQQEQLHDLADGMDPEGFSGPTEKIVKPLTREALAAFQAAQNRAGVIYISRIPPGMRPTKVRHLMSAYGDVGRVYLQQEGTQCHSLTGTRV